MASNYFTCNFLTLVSMVYGPRLLKLVIYLCVRGSSEIACDYEVSYAYLENLMGINLTVKISRGPQLQYNLVQGA